MVIRIITGGPSLLPPKLKIPEKKRRKENRKNKGHMKLNGKTHYQSVLFSFSVAVIDCMGYNFKFVSVAL